MKLLSRVLVLFFLMLCFVTVNAGDQPEGMVMIPGGSFLMGIDEADLSQLAEMGRKVPHMSETHARWWFGDEIPRHEVVVKAFYMDAREVTNRQFAEFVGATGYHAEGDWRKYAKKKGREDHPVVNVTWNDAEAFAEWAGKRLPSEQEWEYAARGGLQVRWYPWGDVADPSKANYRAQGESFLAGVGRLLGLRRIGTEEVAHYPANGYGLFDMIGNVNEWCHNERRPYTDAIGEDWAYKKFGPWGDDKPVVYGKAVRGGGWESSNPVYIRLTGRRGTVAESSEWDLGFRCVKDADAGVLPSIGD